VPLRILIVVDVEMTGPVDGKEDEPKGGGQLIRIMEFERAAKHFLYVNLA
jgi:hypothetical protein